MKDIICNFCGKDKTQVKGKFLVGPNQFFPFICVECTTQCKTLLKANAQSKETIIQFDNLSGAA